jgi:glycosyltransferase involved in cell wall biosynthesis
LIVQPNDLDALTEGLISVVNLPFATRKKFGRLARKRIEDNWSMVSIQRQYEELYTEALSL